MLWFEKLGAGVFIVGGWIVVGVLYGVLEGALGTVSRAWRFPTFIDNVKILSKSAPQPEAYVNSVASHYDGNLGAWIYLDPTGHHSKWVVGKAVEKNAGGSNKTA